MWKYYKLTHIKQEKCCKLLCCSLHTIYLALNMLKVPNLTSIHCTELRTQQNLLNSSQINNLWNLCMEMIRLKILFLMKYAGSSKMWWSLILYVKQVCLEASPRTSHQLEGPTEVGHSSWSGINIETLNPFVSLSPPRPYYTPGNNQQIQQVRCQRLWELEDRAPQSAACQHFSTFSGQQPLLIPVSLFERLDFPATAEKSSSRLSSPSSIKQRLGISNLVVESCSRPSRPPPSSSIPSPSPPTSQSPCQPILLVPLILLLLLLGLAKLKSSHIGQVSLWTLDGSNSPLSWRSWNIFCLTLCVMAYWVLSMTWEGGIMAPLILSIIL